ncbi:unnamed protein product [Microthlaspi erraticum]|uniref:Uncharacterized protein n=1 Tax=Microthlaspi erraticum TaxID=1685480 RepID=A0A6D2I2W6_9BRAS|nr:unnamed protein product [Microthlaspi erraticum]
MVTATKDPSPSHHSAKKVRKALDFNAVVAGDEEAGSNTNHAANERVADDIVPVDETLAQEEGEDGETWWNEVIEEEAGEEEAGEELMEEEENPMETQGSNDMQMEVSDNGGNLLAVEQFVEVEAKEVGKSKVGERKTGVQRKKAVRAAVGVAGGPLRRMIHGAKTPRRKTSAKETQRPGEKLAGRDKEPEKDPSVGSGTDFKAV